jgi:hypothetical protein
MRMIVLLFVQADVCGAGYFVTLVRLVRKNYEGGANL